MKLTILLFLLSLLAEAPIHGAELALSQSLEGRASNTASNSTQFPMGPPGLMARYNLEQPGGGVRSNSIISFALALGPIEARVDRNYQWLRLEAAKANGKRVTVWLLTADYPPSTLSGARSVTARYILQEGDSQPVEFQNAFDRQAVLPPMGGWQHLWPRPAIKRMQTETNAVFPTQAHYLGRRFVLEGVEANSSGNPILEPRVIKLRPDLLIGVPSNTRQKDERRRYDNSDYELVKLTRADYQEMVQAGINCLRVDHEQFPWVEELDAFYWGVGAGDLPYPECLYRSTYLGTSLFLDEPAVGTRDYVIRPRLLKEPEFRKNITPQIVFRAFQEHFLHALRAAVTPSLLGDLKSRPDIELGDLTFEQENLFSWETMVSSAAYQLTQDPLVPAAMVFEPPGRVGTLRTLPEMDMTYGCQIPVDDPKNFTDIIYGFLRGAARLTDKSWGTSIYGAVDRADAFWYLTHAYDLGATRFFFWDSFKIACVPYHECLALARDLSAHAENCPNRELMRLKHAAEVAILLPPGYNLGHVQMGKGSLWGIPELNLERINQKGTKYRAVMSNFFIEIERCLRLGVAFDLLWDLPELKLSGYREVIHVREDGMLQIESEGKNRVLKGARMPSRPSGNAPALMVKLSAAETKAPIDVIARARVTQTSAPVYYTYGTDNEGVYHNGMVSWELYGPGDEDYRVLQPEGLRPRVVRINDKTSEVTVGFHLSRPGRYRLRVATVDVAGRSTAHWETLHVAP